MEQRELNLPIEGESKVDLFKKGVIYLTSQKYCAIL